MIVTTLKIYYPKEHGRSISIGTTIKHRLRVRRINEHTKARAHKVCELIKQLDASTAQLHRDRARRYARVVDFGQHVLAGYWLLAQVLPHRLGELDSGRVVALLTPPPFASTVLGCTGNEV